MKLRAAIAWMPTIVLGLGLLALTAPALSEPRPSLGFGFYTVLLLLLAAIALIFPPFWRRNPRSHWHKVRIIAAGLLVVIAFRFPIETHAVMQQIDRPQQ